MSYLILSGTLWVPIRHSNQGNHPLFTFLFAFLLVYLAIIVVGAWRISHDFTTEEGPLGLYGSIRRGVKAWAESQIDASQVERPADHPLYWVYVGINCPLCVSFTVALLVLLIATSPLTWPLALWWGIAGAISLLDKGLR